MSVALFAGLLRSRAYAFGIVAALALAIAGTAMMFAVLDAVLLKPLPFVSGTPGVDLGNAHGSRQGVLFDS